METAKAWRVEEHSDFKGLKLSTEPPPQQLGEHDCLVKIEASSLNFRDLMVANVNSPPQRTWPHHVGSAY
jgi:NADPH:quinone reductase-like Zn-dependent oxidoreductase